MIIKPNSAKGTQRLGRSLKLIKKSKIKLQVLAASPSLNREIIEIEQRVSKIMSVSTSACCAAILRQQQEENIHHHKQCAKTPVNCEQSTTSKKCTVVENGRVVVKTATLMA